MEGFVMGLLKIIFGFEPDLNKRLLQKVDESKRSALLSVLNGDSDFRDHEEFQDMRVVLCAYRDLGDGVTEQVGKLMDVHVSQLPGDAEYVSPEFFNGLWPYYRVEVTGEPEQRPVYESVYDLDLADGSKTKLKL
jgi:hypothetical protein